MRKLEILTAPEETYHRVCWNYHVKIDGKKFIVTVDEDDNGAERQIFHYDEKKRYGLGDKYDGEDFDGLYTELEELGLFSQPEIEKGTEVELHYDEESSADKADKHFEKMKNDDLPL